MPVHNRIERASVAGSSVATPSLRDPQRDLNEIASHANRVAGIVSALPNNILNGSVRKQHILQELEKASQPAPTRPNLPIPSDVLTPTYLPRIVIGIVGGTGLGKSTLLSSILGKKISPTSDVGRGTAAPTIIIHHPHDHIEASASFMTEKKLLGMIEIAIGLMENGEDGIPLSDGDLKEDPSFALVNETFGLTAKQFSNRIKKISGNLPEGEQGDEQRRAQVLLGQFPDIAKLLGTTVTIRGDDERKFVRALESCVGSARTKKGPKKWALLIQLVIKCNSAVLSNGIILVDLPGSGDCSSTVLHATADMKTKLDVKLVSVFPARAETEEVVTQQIKEEVARRLHHNEQDHIGNTEGKGEGLVSPSTSGLAIIMTHCDAITRKADVQRLEEDEDIGSVLTSNEEYQHLLQELSRAQAALDGKIDQVAFLETRTAELATREPAEIDDTDDEDEPTSAGSKRTSQHNLRSTFSAKRARLSDRAADGGEATEDWNDMDLATVTLKKQQAEEDKRQLHELVQKLESQRLVMAWMARHKILGARLRQQFNALMSEARQDEDGDEDDDMDVDGEDYSLPIFATGAEDFNRSSGDEELEWQTGIPALREFLRHLGARAEDQAILNVLRPFLAQVKSTHALLTATDRENLQDDETLDKLKLSTRWASCEHDSAPQAINETPETLHADTTVKALGIRDHLSAVFAEIVGAKIKVARADVEALRSSCEMAATAAVKAAQKTAQSFMNRKKVHWRTHRAIFEHDGKYRKIKDYNVAFAKPFVDVVEDDLIGHRRGGLVDSLCKQTMEKANALFDNLHEFADDFHKNVQADLHLRIFHCRDKLLGHGVSRMMKACNALLWRSRYLSDPSFFNEAIKAQLKPIYIKAVEDYKGADSTNKMKTYFVSAVGAAAANMFRIMVQDFMKRQTVLIDELEDLAMTELKRIAKECELDISNAWVIPDSDKAQLDARADAATTVKAIEERLSALETEIIQRMQQSEKDVSTCHPPSDQPPV